MDYHTKADAKGGSESWRARAVAPPPLCAEGAPRDLLPWVHVAPVLSAAHVAHDNRLMQELNHSYNQAKKYLAGPFAALCGYILISHLLVVQLLNLLYCHHLYSTTLQEILLLALNPLNQVALNRQGDGFLPSKYIIYR